MLQGDERRRGQLRQREGSSLQEFCWVGISLLRDQCPQVMSTPVELVSTNPPLKPTVLATGFKPFMGIWRATLRDTNGYLCIRRKSIFC